jgi:tetratricopeptide (TPR) repeat protein
MTGGTRRCLGRRAMLGGGAAGHTSVMTATLFLCRIATAAALLPAFGSPAAANDFAICRDQSGDVAIAACSRAIASGTLSQASLAYAFYNRGATYWSKGNLDGALADFNQAIRLRPDVPEYFAGRGLVHESRRDIARARADYTQALNLPDKGDNFAWAKKTAREHLDKLGR